MDYRTKYGDLISKGLTVNGSPSCLTDTKDGYENHHIKPVSWGATDDASNLVRLTYRQHYIAHLLLSKFVRGEKRLQSKNSRMYAATKVIVVQKLREYWNNPLACQKRSEAARNANSKRVYGKNKKEHNEQRQATLRGYRYTCPHCGKSGGGGLLRWHFDHCKYK